jgi:hypothetical protein
MPDTSQDDRDRHRSRCRQYPNPNRCSNRYHRAQPKRRSRRIRSALGRLHQVSKCGLDLWLRENVRAPTPGRRDSADRYGRCRGQSTGRFGREREELAGAPTGQQTFAAQKRAPPDEELAPEQVRAPECVPRPPRVLHRQAVSVRLPDGYVARIPGQRPAKPSKTTWKEFSLSFLHL